MKNDSLYFILSSSCKVVKGAKRSVIIDYGRGDLYFISHPYHTILEKMDRNKIGETKKDFIEEESMTLFETFLSYLLKHEIGFLTTNCDSFPKISDEDSINDYVAVIDAIIEVDLEYFTVTDFETACNELNSLNCRELQIRILSNYHFALLNKIADVVDRTNINYIEIHCDYSPELDIEMLSRFVEDNSFARKIFLYGAPEVKMMNVVKDIPNQKSIAMGTIYFLDHIFDGGKCCGVINHASLSFKNIYLHNQLKTRNGCLDRKISIDKHGNIKNCPSMQKSYGNIKNTAIRTILQNEEFRKFWFINKDQISVCKSCEFRYNCTDCRAFLADPGDIYSKPLKCGYDPFTGTWEDWSTNTLKNKGVAIID